MKIAVLYNLVGQHVRGLDIDKIADNDVLNTVRAISENLKNEFDIIPFHIRKNNLHLIKPNSFDVVINLVETMTSDIKGESQFAGYLELLKIPYTGSSDSALSLCSNKMLTKILLEKQGIPTPKFQVFQNTNDKLDQNIEFPLIVKPLYEDGSIGITFNSVVYDNERLIDQIHYVLKYYKQPALVEEYISGREINVAILGNDTTLEILPISEIQFNDNNYPNIVSFEAKWLKSSQAYNSMQSTYLVKLSSNLKTKITQYAKYIYKLTGLRDYARIDFRVREDIPYVIDINPNPCLSLDSGFVQSAAEKNISYKELIKRIVKESCLRCGVKTTPKPVPHCFSYTTDIKIQKLTLSDINSIFHWFNDIETSKYMDDPDVVYSKEELIEKIFISNQEDKNFLIITKKDNKPIGYCSLYNYNSQNKSAEFSFLIGNKLYLGKGLGSQITESIINFSFNQLKLNILYARMVEKNIPAIKIVTKLGFRKVGILEQAHITKHQKYNEIIFEKINTNA